MEKEEASEQKHIASEVRPALSHSVKLCLSIVVIMILASGALWYWIRGTPQYCLYQVKRACANRDYAKFQELVDVERITNEVAKAVLAAGIRENPGMSDLEKGMLTLMEPTLKKRLQEETWDGLRALVEEGGFSDMERVTIRSMDVSGSVADVTITGHSYLFFDTLGCEVQLKLGRSPRRFWRVLEIRNIADFVGWAPSRSNQLSDFFSYKVPANAKCLVTALKYNDTALFELLKTESSDLTAALIMAVQDDKKEVLRTLLAHGAKVNGRTKVPSPYCDSLSCRETPLLTAIRKGDDDLINLLLSSGADVNLADSTGMTPLMEAAFHGNSKVVRSLLDKGANVKARTVTRGETALMYACEFGPYPEVVEQLLASGADVNDKDLLGRTALSLATNPVTLGDVDKDKVNATVAALKRSRQYLPDDSQSTR